MIASSLHRPIVAPLRRLPASATASFAARGAAPSRLRRAHRLLAHNPAVVCSTADDGLVEVQLKVDGMVCEGCSGRVEEELSKMAGVKQVHVDLEKGLATVQVEAASQADALTLAAAIKDLGFEARNHSEA